MELMAKPGGFLSYDGNTKRLFIDVTVAILMAVRHLASSARRDGRAFCTEKNRKEKTYR